MLKGLRAAAHVFNQKIGLSRLGMVLSFALVVSPPWCFIASCARSISTSSSTL